MERHHSTRRAFSAACLLGAIVTCCLVPAAHAQYFGRNKVQYDHLDFRILESAHFRSHYYPAESLAVTDAARMAERWYQRHASLLDLQFKDNPLIFYADAPDFQQSNVIEGSISQGTGGVTEGLRERVIMPFTGSYADNDHVLGHELVHVFQYRIAAASKGGLQSIGNVPLWLIEGMAEYLSIGRDDPNTAMWLRDAVRRNDLPSLQQLTDDPRYFPYRYGQALWAYIGGRWGDATVPRVFRAALASGWERGVQEALAISIDSLGSQWHAAIRQAYASDIASRQTPNAIGQAVAPAGDRGEQNISPAISPDGRYMAYFSSRGLFGVDLYLAEVSSGTVVRQLTSVTQNPHFDALSFISSAGTWSPDGRQLAFVVYANGDNEIEVMDVQSGDITRRIRVEGVGAMADPAWSPDGRSIAFAGLAGGISDLYVYDLETSTARALTRDREAQLQPAWSPDSRTLAYVTDAGSETDMRVLRFGPMRLAMIDVAQGNVRLIPRLGRGKSINPRFTPDGGSLLFISDQDGVSDLYRQSLTDGAVTRLTHVATGISGITDLSPAMSIATQTGTIVFSVFDDQGYSIRALEANTGGVTVASTGTYSGLLPPATAGETRVDATLENAVAGLPGTSNFKREPYDASLHLDYVGGPEIGIAAGGGYGTGVAGGIAFSFSDQLGNRALQAVVQAQGDVRDIGAQLLYLNRDRRWNWGAQGSHIPVAGGYSQYANRTFTINGQDVPGIVYTTVIQRTYFDNLKLLTQYPLSSTRRIEFSLGGQRIAFGAQVESLYVAGSTPVRRVRDDLPSQSALTFGTGSAALVGDYSFSAFTSPVAGGRYRFEVEPNIGSINYTTALADYRRYLFARPFTFAFRGMHYGRYGGGSDDPRIQPLFVGQPSLVRGYDATSFDPGECQAPASTGSDQCPQFDRLIGSRLAVASAELRIPLFGTEQFGLIPFKWLPLELSPFADAGVAWSQGDKVDLRFDRTTADRVPVFSAGISARMNLLGYAIGELYWARPFQRPGKNWVFGFQLRPGW